MVSSADVRGSGHTQVVDRAASGKAFGSTATLTRPLDTTIALHGSVEWVTGHDLTQAHFQPAGTVEL